MKFSYNWLQEFFSRKPASTRRGEPRRGGLPEPEKLAELLTRHSFEVESVKEVRLPSRKSDFQLDIAILPNRMSDASSHWGVAKEVAALLSLRIKLEVRPLPQAPASPELQPASPKTASRGGRGEQHEVGPLTVKVEDSELCPRYTALVIKGVKVGPSPKGLKEKLEVCGLNSINNVVDAGNYVMLETGQPLHIFDADKLGEKIVVRRGKKGEKIKTLDDKEYDLDEDILVIADAKKPVALAGLKGGKGPEVDFKTKNIVLEAANFHSSSIRKTSKKLGLKTDASLRFSVGLDPNLTDFAIMRLAELIQDLAAVPPLAGRASPSEAGRGNLIDVYPKKVVPAQIKLDWEKVRGLLGVEVSDKEIRDILERLGIKEIRPRPAKTGRGRISRTALFEIPTVRRDLEIEEDLIEEVGRIYGYENIKAKHPLGELILAEENELLNFREKTRVYFASGGFSEVYNYSLSDDSELEFLSGRFRNGLLELENPAKPEIRFLRPSLLPRLFANASFNLRNFKNVRIFEVGNVFNSFAVPSNSGTSLARLAALAKRAPLLAGRDKEEEKLAFVVAGDSVGKSEQSFLEIKGLVSAFFESLAITDFWLDTVPFEDSRSEAAMLKKIFHPFRAAEIKIGERTLGVLGEVGPEIAKSIGTKKAAAAAEIDFKNLFELSQEEREFKPISRYPGIIRDIALLVPLETRISQALDVIEAAGGDFLEDVDLFDVYEGEEIPEGKKNLAFRLVFQSYEKTLTDKEVGGFMEKIVKEMEKNPDWEVRK